MKNIALITGATGGLGQEFVKLHAQRKGDLVLVAREQGALDKLKEAHKSGDIPAIDAAISEMNNVMQTVSQQMYQGAQPGAGAGPQPGAGFQGGAQPGGSQDAGQQGGNDEAQDVDFEEVK